MVETKQIWCCCCEKYIMARLTDGKEVYPYRKDLKKLPFWRCDDCKNWVGCHHKTKNRTRPLGNIPSPELKRARNYIHRLIDPLWQSGKIKRGALYNEISKRMGWTDYHTANLRTIGEARAVYVVGQEIANELNQKGT